MTWLVMTLTAGNREKMQASKLLLYHGLAYNLLSVSNQGFAYKKGD